jgi:hypothetical protein
MTATYREILDSSTLWRRDYDAFQERLALLEIIPLNDRLNVDMCRRVIDALTLHPDLHDQAQWLHLHGAGSIMLASKRDRTLDDFVSCGTTACLAGWTTIIDGGRICDGDILLGAQWPTVVVSDAKIGTWEYGTSHVPISEYAQVSLGLNAREREWLFGIVDRDESDVLETPEQRVVRLLSRVADKVEAARG